MADINAQIGADIRELQRDLRRATGEIQKFTNKTTNNAKEIGTVFKGVFGANIITDFARQGARAIREFTEEALKLADQAKAIIPAFERIGDPSLLAHLVRSTGNTVSNLELMRQAVRAGNFEIPIKQLGKLFEFATIRARETGEGVDFLVNSIISGIGRKSPLILDNLGISAVRLRKELKGVGVETADVGAIAAAVGAIIDEEMTAANVSVKDVASVTDQLNTSMTNLQLTIGTELAPAIDDARSSLSLFVSDMDAIVRDEGLLVGIFSALAAAISPTASLFIRNAAAVKKLEEELKSLAVSTDQVGDGAIELDAVTVSWTGAIAGAELEIKSLNDQIRNAARAELPALGAALDAAKFKLQELQSIVAGTDIVGGVVPTVESKESDLGGILGITPKSIKEAVDRLVATAKAELPRVQQAAQEAMSKSAETVNDIGGSLASAFAGVALAIGETVNSFNSAFNAILETVVNFTEQLGRLMIALGVAEKALLESFSPTAKIAAGIALVALAGLARGLIGKGPEPPSLAIGTNIVHNDGIAQLHRGEAVVPARVAAGGFTGGQIEIVGTGLRYDGKDFILGIEAAQRDLGRVR